MFAALAMVMMVRAQVQVIEINTTEELQAVASDAWSEVEEA